MLMQLPLWELFANSHLSIPAPKVFSVEDTMADLDQMGTIYVRSFSRNYVVLRISTHS